MMTCYWLSAKHDFEREQNRYAFIAEDEATHISTTIDCIMTRTNTLEILLQDHNGDTEFFERIAVKMYNNVIKETGVSLKNLAIAPDGVVSEVYPYSGNEALIGFDFMDLSKPGNIEAREAYEKGDTILTNPFELIQGGIGMAGRKPVIIDSADGKKLWGLVTVTIDFGNLLKVLHFENISGRNIDYELSFIDESGTKHIMQSFGKMSKYPVRKQFSIRNLKWELAIEPSGGWIPVKHTILFVFIFLILSYFVGLFTNLFLKLRDSNAQLLELSITDELTGCFNRRAYETDFSNFQVNPPANDFVYVAADINGLKPVNDTLGHFVGDEIICGTSECLAKCFSRYGKLYRTGGDEFVAMLTVDKQDFARVVAILKEEVAKWKGKNIDTLSVSVGYAEKCDFPDASVNDLAKIADKKMYDEKHNFYTQHGIDRRKPDKN